MKLRIKTLGNDLVVDVNESSSPLIYALMNATLVGAWTSPPKVLTDEKGNAVVPEIEIIKEVAPPDPVIDKMAEAVKAADSRWLEYYSRANKAEARVKELEEKIKSISLSAEPTKESQDGISF